MTPKEMFDAGLIGARALIVTTLIETGYTREEGESILTEAKNRAAWKRYNDEERAIVVAAIAGGIPPAAEIRRIARQVGRTPRSVQSYMERLIADPEAGTKPMGRRPGGGVVKVETANTRGGL